MLDPSNIHIITLNYAKSGQSEIFSLLAGLCKNLEACVEQKSLPINFYKGASQVKNPCRKTLISLRSIKILQ